MYRLRLLKKIMMITTSVRFRFVSQTYRSEANP